MANNEKYNGKEWVGKKYGHLTVLRPVHFISKNGNQQWYWRVVCDCGVEKDVRPYDVISGHYISCGCARKRGEQVYSTHKESHTHLHNVWCGMNNRCNPNHKHCKGYGDRGIGVCKEWEDYEKFAKWARSNGYKEGLSIERIDVNGDYCPENCTWIEKEKQARNRRTTFWIDFRGRRMSLAEAAEIVGLPYKQVHYRIKHGWSIEDALNTPLKEPSDLLKKCKEKGLNYNRIYNRIHVYGWDEEDALNIPIAGKGANQTTYNRKRK